MDERRTDLEKYYKRVLICKLCKKEFGTDSIEDNDNLCPFCHSRMQNHKRWKDERGNI